MVKPVVALLSTRLETAERLKSASNAFLLANALKVMYWSARGVSVTIRVCVKLTGNQVVSGLGGRDSNFSWCGSTDHGHGVSRDGSTGGIITVKSDGQSRTRLSTHRKRSTGRSFIGDRLKCDFLSTTEGWQSNLVLMGRGKRLSKPHL